MDVANIFYSVPLAIDSVIDRNRELNLLQALSLASVFG